MSEQQDSTLTSGQLRDKIEHEEALKRFGGKMPSGDPAVTEETLPEFGRVLRVKKFGKMKSVVGEWY